MTNFSFRQAIVPLLVVFAFGAAAGGFAMSLYMAKTVTAARPANTPEAWRQEYVGKLRKRLNLTDAQVGQLNGILDTTKQRITDVKAKYKPDMDQIQTDQVNSIHGMLQPEQVSEYEKYRAERDRERQKQQQAQNASGSK
jgi:hypothetical protein